MRDIGECLAAIVIVVAGIGMALLGMIVSIASVLLPVALIYWVLVTTGVL